MIIDLAYNLSCGYTVYIYLYIYIFLCNFCCWTTPQTFHVTPGVPVLLVHYDSYNILHCEFTVTETKS